MSQLTEALGQVAERLVAVAQFDADLRARLRSLAQAVLLWTEEAQLSPATLPTDEAAVPAEVPVAVAVVEEPPAVLAPAPPAPEPVAEASPPVVLPPIKFIERSVQPPPSYQPAVAEAVVADADLPMIEARCRLKAEGARWAGKRQQRLDEGADFRMEIDPLDREIIEKAKKLPDCFLWMNHPSGPYLSDQMLVDDLAGSFETMADAVALVRGLLNDPSHPQDDLEEALQLLAETQSALRVAVDNVGYAQDRDQLRVYQWLRATTWNRQVYIARFMKLDDPATSANWPDLSSRIEELDEKVDETRQHAKRRLAAFKRVRYHLNLIRGDTERDHDHDWKVAITTIEELVQSGIPPSNTEIREMLLPVVDRLPDVVIPPGVQLVLREVDRFVSTRLAQSPTVTAVEATAEVKEAAALLRGRTLVLIGGVRRPPAEDALISAFELAGLKWIETREHESIASFEPHIARPEVAAVLLAIRWSSHSYGDVQQFCDQYGKPLVRLPAGYNPNQVAVQVIEQVSDKLRANRGT